MNKSEQLHPKNGTNSTLSTLAHYLACGTSTKPLLYDYLSSPFRVGTVIPGWIYSVRYVIAFFFPWLSLLLQGKILAGILCLVLQITLIGWLPAVIWAFASLNNMYADRRTRRIIRAMKA